MTDNHGLRNGHCEGCQWWQTDTRGHADGAISHGMGLCLHEEIAHFQLQVSGESGCNRFEADDTAGQGAYDVAVEMGAGD